MDRDNKWERTQNYYNTIVNGEGIHVRDYENAINKCYQKDITDEFLPPMLLNPEGTIKDNDCLLWLNFRPDRARQILNALNVLLQKFYYSSLSSFYKYAKKKANCIALYSYKI